jgi:hypothetical protein
MQIIYKVIPAIKIHSNIPCRKGIKPTDFNTALDKPVPIKDRVRVKAILAISTI